MSKVSKTDTGKFVFFCPACGCCHWFNTEKWKWNEDFNSPTVNPSVLAFMPDDGRCHSMVKDGMIQYLADCTHEMAGKTMEIPHFFEREIKVTSEAVTRVRCQRAPGCGELTCSYFDVHEPKQSCFILQHGKGLNCDTVCDIPLEEMERKPPDGLKLKAKRPCPVCRQDTLYYGDVEARSELGECWTKKEGYVCVACYKQFVEEEVS